MGNLWFPVAKCSLDHPDVSGSTAAAKRQGTRATPRAPALEKAPPVGIIPPKNSWRSGKSPFFRGKSPLCKSPVFIPMTDPVVW